VGLPAAIQARVGLLCFGFGSVGVDFCGAPFGHGGKNMCTEIGPSYGPVLVLFLWTLLDVETAWLWQSTNWRKQVAINECSSKPVRKALGG
jgi:hypothetical protein